MSERYTIKDYTFRSRIDAADIQQRVSEVARHIADDYRTLNPVFVVVMKGAMFFAADIIRAAAIPSTIESIAAKSYGSQLSSSGTVTLVNALPDVRGRHVILVEDIVDTGLTLSTISEALSEQEPLSIAIAACIVKPEMLKVELEVKYRCYDLDSAFLIGYGLDYAEHGRELTSIYELETSSNSATTSSSRASD